MPVLLSTVFSNDGSPLLKATQREFNQGLAMLLARKFLGDASFACWDLDYTFSFEVAFPLFIKNNGVANPCSNTRDSLSMHTMEQGHVWIPGLYGDAQPGLLHCWTGRVWPSLINYLGTVELPVVSAQQMGENQCWLAASPGSPPCWQPWASAITESVIFQVPQL